LIPLWKNSSVVSVLVFRLLKSLQSPVSFVSPSSAGSSHETASSAPSSNLLEIVGSGWCSNRHCHCSRGCRDPVNIHSKGAIWIAGVHAGLALGFCHFVIVRPSALSSGSHRQCRPPRSVAGFAAPSVLYSGETSSPLWPGQTSAALPQLTGPNLASSC